MPVVSIILPAYNQATHLGQAIASVLAQTYTDWELIVVDDGSTDGTGAVARSFTDPRVRYFYQANQERSRARNFGIQQATGEFIAFLDDDDFWLPPYLEKQVAHLRAHPAAGLSHTWSYDTDPAGRMVRVSGQGVPGAATSEAFLAALLINNRIRSIAVVVRAEALHAAGLFDPEVRQAEDWDLWLRIAQRYPVTTLPEALVCYRRYNLFMPARLKQRGMETALTHIVEKNFAALKDSPLYALRGEALGWAHWRVAFGLYALGDIPGGQARLRQALAAYPPLFAAPYQAFIESAAYQADELYDLFTPLDEALTCLRRFFDHLPAEAAALRPLRRRTLGHYAGLHVFRSYERRDRAGTRRAAWLAVRAAPHWLRNRGFAAIAGRALSGWGWPAQPPSGV